MVMATIGDIALPPWLVVWSGRVVVSLAWVVASRGDPPPGCRRLPERGAAWAGFLVFSVAGASGLGESRQVNAQIETARQAARKLSTEATDAAQAVEDAERAVDTAREQIE